MMVMVFPAVLFAEPAASGMLYAHGTTLVNGSSIPRSSALFSGDLIQTDGDSVANINATGSAILVLNNSIVQYEGNALKLEHGGITVSTSKLLATHAGDVTVSPAAASGWTEFEVRDVDGRVQIAARKGDLTISDDSGTTTLTQGQETTLDESGPTKNKKKKKREGAAPPAARGVLDSPVAIGIGTAAIGGVTAWALIRDDNPASPTR
jgi:hypothetical protein